MEEHVMSAPGEKYGPWALIAGGSEGVGASFARKLAAAGINLVLVARKQAALEALAASVREGSKVQVRTLPLDLTAPDMLARLRAVTDDVDVGLLIYNAGVAHSFAEFLDAPVEEALTVAKLNVDGQIILAHHFGGLMRKRGRGGIILVGSVAGVAGGGRTAAYSGAKAFSHALAEALWYELKPYGVDVKGLIVGLTRTPTMIRQVGATEKYMHNIAEPDQVAQEGLEHLGDSGPCHVISLIEDRVRGLRTLPREQAVTAMSKATASFEPHA